MPSIKAVEARLHVADIARSASFYATTLGFQIGTSWPEQSPEFAILNKDTVRLQLAKISSESASPQIQGSTLWLDVADISGLHASIKRKVSVEWGPEIYAYGRSEFAFKDPDGHLVILSEVANDPRSSAAE
jgi:Glyoxalase/Bleomycin resistance protein/Dioxygenase superfamily